MNCRQEEKCYPISLDPRDTAPLIPLWTNLFMGYPEEFGQNGTGTSEGNKESNAMEIDRPTSTGTSSNLQISLKNITVKCSKCRSTSFRLFKINRSKSQEGKIRTQADRANWLRHLKHCQHVLHTMECQQGVEKHLISEFQKECTVNKLESREISCHLQHVANVFLGHWNDLQWTCSEAIAAVKIAKHLDRMTKTLVNDQLEPVGTCFVPIPRSKMGNLPSDRVFIVVALEKRRRTKKPLDFENLPTIVENNVQKALKANLNFDFQFRRVTNGGSENEALIVPFEFRVLSRDNLGMKMEFLVSTLNKIANSGGVKGEPSLRYRLFRSVVKQS
mmetsp:Transcript_33503/g.81286  ORF Transcript_33503/g.81286 Transcript_33503/m.81286 type:complete len:332 (+) Transcript_33503:197-1192(+)